MGQLRPATGAALLAVCGMLVMSQLYVTLPLSDSIATALATSDAAASLLPTTFAMSCAVGFLAFGPLSDVVGRRAVLAPGLVALAVVTAAAAAAPSLPVLHVLRGLQGLAAGTFSPPAVAYVNESLPVRMRPAATSGLTTGYLFAAIVGQVYAGVLDGWGGWRLAVAAAAPVLLLFAVVVRRLPAEPARTASSATITKAFRAMPGLLRRPRLRASFVVGFPILLIVVALYAGLRVHAAVAYGASVRELQLVRLAGLPGMALVLLSGPVVRRAGALPVVVAGLALSAAGLLASALDIGFGWIAAASIPTVAGVALTLPAHLALIRSRAREETGSAMAIAMFLTLVGASAGAPVALGLLRAGGFRMLCLVLSACAVLAAAAVAATYERPGRAV